MPDVTNIGWSDDGTFPTSGRGMCFGGGNHNEFINLNIHRCYYGTYFAGSCSLFENNTIYDGTHGYGIHMNLRGSPRPSGRSHNIVRFNKIYNIRAWPANPG